VGVAVATGRDQPDVFWNRSVRRTGPLAIHDLVEIVGCRNVSILHLRLVHAHVPRLLRDSSHARSGVRPVSLWFGSWGPNPGRNVVDQPREFHRYRRHTWASDAVGINGDAARSQLGSDTHIHFIEFMLAS